MAHRLFLFTAYFSLLVSVSFTEVGKPCSDNSECNSDECCQILSEFMVVSRSAVIGSCQKYALEGEPCGLYDKLNGYCSCLPGTSCTAVEVPIPVKNKRRPLPPRPGYMYNITCTRDAS